MCECVLTHLSCVIVNSYILCLLTYHIIQNPLNVQHIMYTFPMQFTINRHVSYIRLPCIQLIVTSQNIYHACIVYSQLCIKQISLLLAIQRMENPSLKRAENHFQTKVYHNVVHHSIYSDHVDVVNVCIFRVTIFGSFFLSAFYFCLR